MFRYFTSALFFSLLLGLTISKANAGIIYSAGDTITHIQQIPEDVVPAENGKSYHLGWKHGLFSIFWIPLAGSPHGEYVIYTDTWVNKTYTPLTSEDLTYLSSALGNEFVNEKPPITWFSVLWGWLFSIPIIWFVLKFVIFPDDELATSTSDETVTSGEDEMATSSDDEGDEGDEMLKTIYDDMVTFTNGETTAPNNDETKQS